MFRIIGFIPQISQGLFSFEDKYFAINPPFKKYSLMSISKSDIDDTVPYVKDYAYYEELEHVFQHFEKAHLLEMLNNKNIISKLEERFEKLSSSKGIRKKPTSHSLKALLAKRAKGLKMRRNLQQEAKRIHFPKKM